MTAHPIPESNILDLRTPPPAPPRRRWQRPPRAPRDRPPRARRDWRPWRREVYKFLVAVLVIVIPGGLVISISGLFRAAGAVQSEATTGGRALQRGVQALTAWDQTAAAKEFSAANASFKQAADRLDKALGWAEPVWRALPIAGRKIRSAEAALNAGQELSSTAVQAADLLRDSPKPESVSITNDGVLRGSLGFLGPLLNEREAFRDLLVNLSDASAALAQVDARDVPDTYKSGVEVWKRLHPIFFGSDQRVIRVYDLLTELFASHEPREFVVLFQNDDELRPTGGFPGTFLLMKSQAGTFSILDSPVTGPYDVTVQGPKTILPPQPILAVAPYWNFQDAAWFLDAPTSAKFVLDFYERGRGFRPGGVIYVTPALFEDLLHITGPIRPPGYGLHITADNFVRATELQVEFGYDKALNNPKQFLLDLMPAFFDRLGQLPSPKALQALMTTFDHAGRANLILTSEIQKIMETSQALHWDGKLLPSDHDYLAVVHTNLGGGKTDRAMREQARLTVEEKDGRLQHTLKFHREHTGDAKDVLTGHPNRTFIRVYTPLASTLTAIDGATTPPPNFFLTAAPGAVPDDALREAEGKVLVDEQGSTRITEESGRRVYGFWSIVDPGKTQDMTVTYSTPISRPWDLVWQKQPGAQNRGWEVQFKAPKRIKSAVPAADSHLESSHVIRWETSSEISREFRVEY